MSNVLWAVLMKMSASYWSTKGSSAAIIIIFLHVKQGVLAVRNVFGVRSDQRLFAGYFSLSSFVDLIIAGETVPQNTSNRLQIDENAMVFFSVSIRLTLNSQSLENVHKRSCSILRRQFRQCAEKMLLSPFSGQTYIGYDCDSRQNTKTWPLLLYLPVKKLFWWWNSGICTARDVFHFRRAPRLRFCFKERSEGPNTISTSNLWSLHRSNHLYTKKLFDKTKCRYQFSLQLQQRERLP